MRAQHPSHSSAQMRVCLHRQRTLCSLDVWLQFDAETGTRGLLFQVRAQRMRRKQRCFYVPSHKQSHLCIGGWLPLFMFKELQHQARDVGSWSIASCCVLHSSLPPTCLVLCPAD